MLTTDVIEKATENFREALQLMSEDGHTMHAFDLGQTPDGTMLSILLIVDTQQRTDVRLASLCGGAVIRPETS